jgi:hypothetical protein
MKRYEEIYERLREYDKPLEDLMAAYGDFIRVKEAFLQLSSIGRDCLDEPGARILFNPEYMKDKSRFPFITEELDKECFDLDELADELY